MVSDIISNLSILVSCLREIDSYLCDPVGRTGAEFTVGKGMYGMRIGDDRDGLKKNNGLFLAGTKKAFTFVLPMRERRGAAQNKIFR
ncbi:hypothetical protein Echvi_4627 [Echinicola vietnamensis DSM 17526]|uniref:Uncharacterized protein n=1 Tax=Echinicola vietnamensis (strain DSM 17526 / LMG 23754 / KMM 6221) TaxID=926556 RepID=L0G707_ECHVK|nr:hypothetical protein Echvi_4627 [Echinicola vietnamensis DSM 17526]